MEPITDLRVRRTYRLLTDALMELMQKKPFEKITVIEICSQAMVHRATFYKYFEDKYQLLDYCVIEIGDRFKNEEGLSMPVKSCREYFLSLMRCLLNEFEIRKDIYLTILKRNKSDYLIHRVQETITYRMCEKFEECKNGGMDIPVPCNMLAHFYSGACISVLYWWLDNGGSLSVDKVIEHMETVMRI